MAFVAGVTRAPRISSHCSPQPLAVYAIPGTDSQIHLEGQSEPVDAVGKIQSRMARKVSSQLTQSTATNIVISGSRFAV